MKKKRFEGARGAENLRSAGGTLSFSLLRWHAALRRLWSQMGALTSMWLHDVRPGCDALLHGAVGQRIGQDS